MAAQASGRHPKWVVGSIDQGTTSTRVVFYDHNLTPLVTHQLGHKQITPKPGWLQHSPKEILSSVNTCLISAFTKLRRLHPIDGSMVKGIGITNQRETIVVWDARSGEPLYDAVVWCDLRTQEIADEFATAHGKDKFRTRTGLPVSPYFSAFKVKWLIENVKEVREGLSEGWVRIGTIDSWLLWHLTGGRVHATSVCNASRTYLMDLRKQQWDEELCRLFSIPLSALPTIVSNAEPAGKIGNQLDPLQGVPITGVIGDQHAASVGQMCFTKGDTKNTYGTGCFLLMNTGTSPKPSAHGLLTTIGYKIGEDPATYALEGSVVQAGMLITWLRDNLEIISKPSDTEALAATVSDSGGVAIVPAFAGLFAPHWRSDARGVITGLTMHTTKAHICRAALSAICMQTVEVLQAMEKDSGLTLKKLKVDGGMTGNTLLMQMQANLAAIDVIAPINKETTALGAAMCAAVGAKCLRSLHEAEEVISRSAPTPKIYTPKMDEEERRGETIRWQKALHRSLGWTEERSKL